MNAIPINQILFAVLAVGFIAVGFSAARKQRSLNEYFHNKSFTANVVSLTATNMTLGTGVVYLITGARHNGLLMLLPAVAVALGYWLMGEFLERVVSQQIRAGKNFLAGIDDQIANATQRPSYFAKIVSSCLVSVFVLLLAFEIFASAKVIAPFLFQQPNEWSEALLATAVYLITVAYAVLGGARAMFRVDAIQVPLVCLFVPLFFVIAVPDWEQPERTLVRLSGTLKTDQNVIVAILIACLNSIATQFYSILNWGAVSNVEPGKQKRLLRAVGVTTACLLSIFVLVGLLHPPGTTGNAWQDLSVTLNEYSSQTHWQAAVVSGLVLLGMISILLTTTDAVVVNCIMFWHDNVSGGNSKSTKPDPVAISKVRRIGVVAFSICFAVLLLIHYTQPDPFYLLLSMAGGVLVFAPPIVTAGILARRPENLRVFHPTIVFLFLGLFLVSGAVDVVLLATNSPLVPYIGLASFLISSILCLFLMIQVRVAAK